MADDDEELDGDAEDLLTPPGARRSTYSPPPIDPTTLENAANLFNDDAIAAALAAELARISSGPINTIRNSGAAATGQKSEQPADEAPQSTSDESPGESVAAGEPPADEQPDAVQEPPSGEEAPTDEAPLPPRRAQRVSPFLDGLPDGPTPTPTPAYLAAPAPTAPPMFAPPPPGYDAPAYQPADLRPTESSTVQPSAASPSAEDAPEVPEDSGPQPIVDLAVDQAPTLASDWSPTRDLIEQLESQLRARETAAAEALERSFAPPATEAPEPAAAEAIAIEPVPDPEEPTDEPLEDSGAPTPPPLVEPPPVPTGSTEFGAGLPAFDSLLSVTPPVRESEAEPVAPADAEPLIDQSPDSPPIATEAPGVAPEAFDGRFPLDAFYDTDDEFEPATPTRRMPAFRVEPAGPEPTPLELRGGHAARLFWLWFAANSSVVSVAFGGILFSLGMSLRQAVVATLAGVALSFLPLGLGTLAGKRSGQPTMIVSRATFGVIGNILPAIIGLLSRVFWGAALLWIVAAGTSSILVGAGLTGGLAEMQLTVTGVVVGLVIALAFAYFGYALIARLQAVLSILSAILVIGFIALTARFVDLSAALTVPDGSWALAVTAAVLVFSFVGLAWANSSSDLARYQRPTSSGATSMLWATFGTALPSFLLIAYGIVLAASNPMIGTGLVERPLDTLGQLLPVWYPIPLVAATALSLLSGVVISVYSGGFALQATGLRAPRALSTLIVGVLLAVVTAAVILVATDFTSLFRDFATTLAVPVAAWAGIFAAETMIRNRGFHSASLLARGGVYPDVRWVNLVMLVVATAIGFGLTSATVDGLAWQGYLFPLAGVPLAGDLAASDLGVIVALLVGLLTPIVAGIPSIRRQERVEASHE